MDSYIIRCSTCHTANRVPASSEGKAGRCGNCHALLRHLYTQPVALSEKSFDTFLSDFRGWVVVEFWAPWCPHCLEFEHVVRAVAKDMAGKGVIAQVNTQENPRLAERFSITGVPSVIVFRKGKAGERVNGAMSKQNFLAWCEKLLA